MVNEWQEKPFVSVTARDSVCEDDEEVLFPVYWPGTAKGCQIVDNDSDEDSENEEPKVVLFDSLSEEQQQECSKVIDSVDGIVQSRFFGGVSFCGKRGSLPYKDQVRALYEPQKLGVSCPTGYLKCS